MSGSHRVTESETKPILGTAANKASPFITYRAVSKSLRKLERSSSGLTGSDEKIAYASQGETLSSTSQKHTLKTSSILRRQEQVLNSNLSLNASFSSDASEDLFQSRASTGRSIRSRSVGSRSMSYPSEPRSVVSQFFEVVRFGREVFSDFDPNVIVKLNEKKLMGPGSAGSTLLSELKLRAVIDPSFEHILEIEVIEEYGSFDKYIWSFVKNKATVSKFRRQG